VIDIVQDKNYKFNIWLLGMHWNRCVRTRLLGYLNLLETLTTENLDVKVLTKMDCVLENLIERRGVPGISSITYERFPDFNRETVTDLQHVEEQVYQILGTHHNWDGTI
jgi:hypothetical protein